MIQTNILMHSSSLYSTQPHDTLPVHSNYSDNEIPSGNLLWLGDGALRLLRALSLKPFAGGKTGQGFGNSLRTFVLEAHVFGRTQNSPLDAECGYASRHLHSVQGI